MGIILSITVRPSPPSPHSTPVSGQGMWYMLDQSEPSPGIFSLLAREKEEGAAPFRWYMWGWFAWQILSWVEEANLQQKEKMQMMQRVGGIWVSDSCCPLVQSSLPFLQFWLHKQIKSIIGTPVLWSNLGHEGTPDIPNHSIPTEAGLPSRWPSTCPCAQTWFTLCPLHLYETQGRSLEGRCSVVYLLSTCSCWKLLYHSVSTVREMQVINVHLRSTNVSLIPAFIFLFLLRTLILFKAVIHLY